MEGWHGEAVTGREQPSKYYKWLGRGYLVNNSNMDILLKFLWVFLVGGTICMIGQILVLKTKWTTSRILVAFVTVGIILGAAGGFKTIREAVGAGITVPIVGFGGVLAEGSIKAVQEDGVIGIFMGGLAATAAGVAAAITSALIVSLVAKSRSKT